MDHVSPELRSRFLQANAEAIDQQLRRLLAGQFASLTISFNEHSCDYTLDVAEAIRRGRYDLGDWVSDDEKAKAIAGNSVWALRWYPDTPIGFYQLQASTLAAVVDAALATKAEA